MSDDQAKERLIELLDRYTAGSILHLLAEIYRKSAEETRQSGDPAAYEQSKTFEHALFVLGLGIDGANASN